MQICIFILFRASCTAFAAPALGGLSDRIGRKSVRTFELFQYSPCYAVIICTICDVKAENCRYDYSNGPTFSPQVALIVVFGSIITMLLELRAVDFWSYMLSRVTFGLTRAAMPVANGVMVDLFSSAEERSAALSKNGAAVGVGFLIGAALGGALVGCVPSVASLANLNY